MPLDDFRRQIPERDKVDLDMISHCADRYRVSLIAAVLRWLQYAARRAVLVVSRDGYIMWSRASRSALKTGAFFRTSGPPIAIPPDSSLRRAIRLRRHAVAAGKPVRLHPARPRTGRRRVRPFHVADVSLRDNGVHHEGPVLRSPIHNIYTRRHL
jgi:hypothetical protein